MKKSPEVFSLALAFTVLVIAASLTSCKPHSQIKYPNGTFPDSVTALTDINSVYDDKNSDIYVLRQSGKLLFSSNRNTSGGEFDIIQGYLAYTWDQTNGNFTKECGISTDPFLVKLLTTANSTGNDFGPYTMYSPTDGYEYLLYASDKTGGGLDFYYTKNRPWSGTTLPDVLGPFPITRLNSSSDDAYISFDTNQDSAYFSSSAGGNYDIYLEKRSADTTLATWFGKPYNPAAAVKVDSINSTSDDICPFVYRNMLVFASNRPGGLGLNTYDLYYSIFRNGKWSSPMNFGPPINTEYNEYRPIISSNNSFTNSFMIFSSDRPNGKGGYDLYFVGF